MFESRRYVKRHNTNAFVASKLALQIFYLIRLVARHVSSESVQTQRSLYCNEVCYGSFILMKIESLHAAIFRDNKPNVNDALHITR